MQTRGGLTSHRVTSYSLGSCGLWMSAFVCKLAGVPTRILGGNTPSGEILDAVTESRVFAIGLSSCHVNQNQKFYEELQYLKFHLPENTPLVLGGSPLKNKYMSDSVKYFADCHSFHHWLKNR